VFQAASGSVQLPDWPETAQPGGMLVLAQSTEKSKLFQPSATCGTRRVPRK
jgi:hypothetical protein